jgi:hypothetical protein
MKTQQGDSILGVCPYFDIWHNWDERVVSSTHWQHFTPKEIPWYSFLLEAEWVDPRAIEGG